MSTHRKVTRPAVAGALALAALSAGAALGPAGATHVDVTAVAGGAYGYFTDVSLFGGPSSPRGPAPAVTLPAAGGNVSATDPDGDSATYGPAVLFQSGAMTVSSQGTLGPTGSVTSTADVVGYQDTADTDPDPDGPGPFLYTRATSTCTADGSGAAGSTTILGGVLETKYDPVTQEPTVTEPVPQNPAPNYTRTGTIDHVGDSYRIVFNEQVVAADGTLTVNAAHMYLLGPTAVGEVVIGQSVCDVTGTALPHPADLSVSVADSADPVNVRSQYSYTVTVANAGPDGAAGVSVFSKPTGAKYVSASGATCVAVKGKNSGIRCDLGTLAAGAETSFTLTVAAPTKPGTASLTSTVSATTTDDNPANDSDTEATSVQRL